MPYDHSATERSLQDRDEPCELVREISAELLNWWATKPRGSEAVTSAEELAERIIEMLRRPPVIPTDLTPLAQAAKALPLAEWHQCCSKGNGCGGCYVWLDSDCDRLVQVGRGGDDEKFDALDHAVLKYIALAHPAQILAMCAEIQALRQIVAAADDLRALCRGEMGETCDVQRYDALRSTDSEKQ